MIRFRAKIVQVPVAQYCDEPNSMDAFQELFKKSRACSTVADSGKRPLLPIKMGQARGELHSELTVSRSHVAISSTAREIQSRIAMMASLVTPKLLCRLWLYPRIKIWCGS